MIFPVRFLCNKDAEGSAPVNKSKLLQLPIPERKFIRTNKIIEQEDCLIVLKNYLREEDRDSNKLLRYAQ